MTESSTATAERTYPRHWEADVVASDGGVVHLRPILPSDADALVAMHSRLSERTRYLRYFGPYPYISPRDLERFTVVDHRTRVAFIALLGDEIIAVGRYEGLPGPGEDDVADPPRSAEVAFVVQDDHQGRGLGSILLEHLSASAREVGVRRFEAEVLAENHQMVRVFRDAGYQVSRQFEDEVLHLEFDVDPTERSIEVRDSREQRAEARSVHNVLHPRSVAVIGASADPGQVGNAVFVSLLRGAFAGPVYPVTPDVRSVHAVRAYATVTDIPDEVDLAVVAVASGDMAGVMDSCLAKGVKALVVVGPGYIDETVDGTSDGAAARRRLADEARAHGMRVVGPNALGVANTDPEVRLNATLAPHLPGRGRVGFFSQSGALGVTLLATAAERGLGLSTFVSAGNRADLSGNDLLQYWQTDASTDVVLLYLETFGNPRKFARLARRLARTKPVVAVKSGRWASSTPGSAGSSMDDATVQSLFEQSGVIRVENVTQMFDTALLLAHQPLPAGSRVAVVGNSTALNTLVVDALHDEGLVPAGQPVDAGTSVSPADLAAAAGAALHSDGVDALVVVFVPPLATVGGPHAVALREAVGGSTKPVVTTFLAAEGMLGELAVPGPDGAAGQGSVPSYPTPERAVAALSRVTRYARRRTAPVGEYVRPAGIDPEGARALVEARMDGIARAATAEPLGDDERVALLQCYGIDMLAFRRVTSAADAVAAARELGFPVAVKATGERWRHRVDGAGVRLNVVTDQGARQAFADLARASGNDEAYVQRMASPGTSCVFEVSDDPSFGSLLSFGLSGMATELLGDRAYRVLPVSTTDAAELVRAPRAAPLLAGYRGEPPVRLEGLEELAVRLSRLASDLPEIRSLVLDPVIAGPDGVAVGGARIVVGPPPTREETGPRRLQ